MQFTPFLLSNSKLLDGAHSDLVRVLVWGWVNCYSLPCQVRYCGVCVGSNTVSGVVCRRRMPSIIVSMIFFPILQGQSLPNFTGMFLGPVLFKIPSNDDPRTKNGTTPGLINF